MNICVQFQNLKSPSPSKSTDCQTFSDDLQIPCNVCIYVATCEEELNWHKDYDHDITSELYFETDFPCDICGKWCRTEADRTHHLKLHEVSSKSHDPLVKCKLCAKTFETKTSLMVHSKKEHTEKTSVCWNFLADKCDLGDDFCWFIHSEDSRKAEFSSFNCNLCEKIFENINDLLHHKKREHVTRVKECNNSVDNTCRFGDQHCWFRHDNQKKVVINDKQDVTEQIFQMMEKFTQRILDIENKIIIKNN